MVYSTCLSSIVTVTYGLAEPICGQCSMLNARQAVLFVDLKGSSQTVNVSTVMQWLVFFRFWVGLGLGWVPVSFTLYMELMPTKGRGVWLIWLEVV